MTQQSEALRLADKLDADRNWLAVRGLHQQSMAEAAAELRRLDVLLAALRALVQNEGLDAYAYLDKGIGTATAAGQRWLNARAAIALFDGPVSGVEEIK